ncbi:MULTISPECIES: sensor histidine kinase [Clostridium]|uniref:histidine kinase n=3 Tax=Clostridium TaxID=1485 RepID=D8GMB5_CLOLD|nr:MULTISPECIES: ATP-binding protein [Clostridium]ADK13525.1 predicted sensor histidine kinase [Clostridium ljungdahlii DSM 13528]OAA89143.1 Alkaline phosphatase synthesis sensor protein PhoR [Clostridium ljungdahlii DSM 13528]OAA94215.1 Alkaline phosphatase synthesis sensor protein PhoR [Clostridium coskatii]OBR95621.1 alkaline phosphatase synthesis sensor protein PhoR [Clostridium coskatii]
MFRKLKIQLILINLILTSLVLITIFSGIYILMNTSFEHSAYMRMSKTAEMENIPPSGPHDKNMTASESFFIKINFKNQIEEISPNSPLSEKDYKELLEKILKKDKLNGTSTYGNYILRYIKVPKSYGLIVVFQDKAFDDEVLRRLITISVTIYIISLVFVFIISLFLANISLKPIINAWKKQKAFTADASHELRTPLAVITTNLDIVLDNKDETVESQDKWLKNIKIETTRMTKLIEDLLFLARSDSHKNGFDTSSFDISSAVTKSVVPLEPVATKHKIAILSDIHPDIIFLGNEGRINQLITILVDNAIKHTPEGGSIKVTLGKIKNKIEITVSDTGEGIAPEHLNKIFERFYKVDKSRSNRQGNFGLGLSIAKCIVEEHNGTIDVSSTVGKGSTFKVIFPVS